MESRSVGSSIAKLKYHSLTSVDWDLTGNMISGLDRDAGETPEHCGDSGEESGRFRGLHRRVRTENQHWTSQLFCSVSVCWSEWWRPLQSCWRKTWSSRRTWRKTKNCRGATGGHLRCQSRWFILVELESEGLPGQISNRTDRAGPGRKQMFPRSD